MAQVTQQQSYKRSLAGSVGAGVSSVLGGSGKQYFILEHKVGSKHHKAGETQEIIVDQIEIGRDPKCQVRYDDHFETVSRQHAAIVKEGANWKLIPLSKTNPTILNGKKVQKEWFLQNGDEIQCSVNGPKLGFIIPTGNKATVGSIGFTRRLTLFRKQALRPYQRAINLLTLALALVIIGSVGWNYWQYVENEKEKEGFKMELAEKQKQIETAIARADSSIKINATLRRQFFDYKSGGTGTKKDAPPEIQDLLEACKDDVYYLETKEVYLSDGSRKRTIEGLGWSGTGFLLNDGRFVTARHCVQGWRFYWDANKKDLLNELAIPDNYPGVEIIAVLGARSKSGKNFTFVSKNFVLDDGYDRRGVIGTSTDGTPIYFTSAGFAVADNFWSTDWAYIQTGSKGNLSFDAALSGSLRTGTDLHVLGFPQGHGVGESASFINPTYNSFSVGFDGLDNTGCFLHTRGVDHGNSGGPIFVRKENVLVVVGIVSRGSHKSEEYNYGIPVSAIR